MPPPIRVELVPHSPEWSVTANAEATRILSALGSNVAFVHHIGSTSIPGICAKPILDLMPEVASLARLDQDKPRLLDLGYDWWDEYGIANRRYCTLDDPKTGYRKVQIHCFQTGDPEIEKHLAFRDFLRSNSETAREYEADKKRCRDLHPENSHDYSDAKAHWISSQVPLALAFYRSRLISKSYIRTDRTTMEKEQIPVVVIVSANAEWSIVCRQFANFEIHESHLGQYIVTGLPAETGVEPIIFFHGGWGKIAAAASAQYVIDRWKPFCIVNLGTCGGFKGSIEKGDVVLATSTTVYDLVELMGNQDDAITHYKTEIDLSWLGEVLPTKVVKAPIVSADRDVAPGEIKTLASKFGASAADWESGAIAYVARRNNVRCLILRGVSDLVADHGGEAYGQLATFHDGADSVMNRLMEALPAWITCLRKALLQETKSLR